jgi:hypothetical protein
MMFFAGELFEVLAGGKLALPPTKVLNRINEVLRETANVEV